MDFVTLVHRFKFFFGLCGVGEFNVQAKASLTWKARLADNLLAISYLLVVIAMYGLVLYGRMVSPVPFTSVNVILALIHVCCEFVLHLTITGQALFYREKMKRLVRTYDKIQRYMLKRMNYSVDFENLGKRFIPMIAVLFIPCLGMLIFRLTTILTIGLSLSTITVVFYFLSGMVQLHIIVHIELLKFLLNSTLQWLGTRATEVSANGFHQPDDMLRKQYSAVLHLKWIHFKLYELSTKINRIFGWSLTVLILRNAVEIAYGAYWFYLVQSFMFDPGFKFPYTGLIRKKIYVSILFAINFFSAGKCHCITAYFSAFKSHHIVKNIEYCRIDISQLTKRLSYNDILF